MLKLKLIVFTLLAASICSYAQELNPELAAKLFFTETEEGVQILSLALRESMFPRHVPESKVADLFARLQGQATPETQAALDLARARVSDLEANPEIKSLERDAAQAATEAERLAARAKLLEKIREAANSAQNPAAAVERAYVANRERFLAGPPPAPPVDPAVAAAHDAITTDLFNGYVTEGQMVRENGNAHNIYKVKIFNPRTGRFRDAYFKPRRYGDSGGWDRTPLEYVAYSMNRKIGLDYVPPVAYRYGLTINGKFFHEGALIYAMPEARILMDAPEAEWGMKKLAVISDSRVMNVLLGNPDGHFKNLLLGRHWVDGALKPAFIDFGAGLRPGANPTMVDYGAFRNSDAIYWVRRSTLDGLKRLSAADFGDLHGFLSDAEIQRILTSRDGIVSYFEDLRAKFGDGAVILDE
jgi:hypothetical protein